MFIRLPTQAFEEVFPFHIAFDRGWRILQSGKSLSRLCPSVKPGVLFTEHFAPCRPERPFDFDEIAESPRTLFLIREKASSVLLRGQMINLRPKSEVLLFLGSPWFTEVAQIRSSGLSFDDFAIHDPAVDFLQVLQSQKTAVSDLKTLTETLKRQRTALREANERLRYQETESRKLALIAARTDNAVVLTDARGRTEWVNEGFTRLTGYTLEEARGRTPGSLLQGLETNPATVDYMRDQIRKGEGFSAEIQNYSKAGRKYWLAIEVQPIMNDEGLLTNFMAIESDVTERRAAQQRLAIQYQVSSVLALAESMATAMPLVLQAICENLGWQMGAIWRLQGEDLHLSEVWHSPSANVGAFIATSRAMTFAHGVGLPGRVWAEARPVWIPDVTSADNFPRSTAAAHEGLHGAVAFPVFVHGEVWGVMEFFSRRIQEPDEELLRTFNSVGSQIGQYIVLGQAEEALRATSTLQQAILESASYSIISTSQDGIIQTFNAAAERMLGYTSGEMVGKATPAILHDEEEVVARAAELSRELGRTVEPGFEAFVAKAALGQTDQRQWTYIRKDGSRLPVMLSVTPLVDEREGITGYLGVASDITQQKHAEEALLRAKESAEDANRAKSEFLAVMSHEIRTPMNGILGMASLLLDTRLDDRQREFVTTLRQSSEALLEIINDILDFSKIESHALALEPEDFALNGLVEGVVDLLAPRAVEKRIGLTVVVDPQAPNWLRGDDGRVRQVLINLLGNGVKFTDEGDVVLRIRCVARSGECVRLRFSVTDSGIGIDPEQQCRLFQPFTQVDLSSRRRYGGTGLGLAISKKLVELMHGTIGLESQPGQGSTFWFEVGFDPPQVSPPPSNLTGLEGWTAVVVSPHAPTQEALEGVFGSLGLPSQPVSQQSEALDRLRLRHDERAVVVIDSLLGWRESLELARSIREEEARSGVRTLLVLPLTHVEGAQEAALEAFDRYAYRPLKSSDILRCLVALAQGDSEAEKQPSSVEPGVSEVFRAPESPRMTNRSLRILVAEDHDTNRRLVALMLERLGYRAEFVADGLEAVETVRKTLYDVVLMDCQMPYMDGYEATQAIRKIEAEEAPGSARHLQIIAMTANAMRGDREKCLEAGMDGYISKPITLETLGHALAQLTPASEPQNTPAPQAVESSEKALQTLVDEFGAEAMAELVESYLRDTPVRLEEITRLAQTKADAEALARSAHALAGSSSIFGLDRFRECALELERAAKVPAWDRCAPAVEVVKTAYASAESLLRERLKDLKRDTPQPKDCR